MIYSEIHLDTLKLICNLKLCWELSIEYMTCVFLMMECIYGCDGMDPSIPNEAISHGSSLSDTPFMAVERQQHLSLLMKNYQSPRKILTSFTVFPLYCLHRLYAFLCCSTVATDVLSPLSTQACDNVIHNLVICSVFRQSLFLPSAAQPPRDDFFFSPLTLCQYLSHVKKHIISFNQFNQFVVNESDKNLPDHKRPSYMSWDFSASCSFFFLMSTVFLPIT